jgi:hypothetical protein
LLVKALTNIRDKEAKPQAQGTATGSLPWYGWRPARWSGWECSSPVHMPSPPKPWVTASNAITRGVLEAQEPLARIRVT